MLPQMSALGQKRTCALHKVMSALPPIPTAKADISLAPVELASRRKKRGLSVEYDWANWDSVTLSEALLQTAAKKDKKLAANSEHYDELLLAFVTDEELIDSTLVAAVLIPPPTTSIELL
jgi:hypothetical protein